MILCGHLAGRAFRRCGHRCRLILYLNAFGFAKTERFFTAKTYKWMTLARWPAMRWRKLFLLYRSERYPQHHSARDAGAILSSGLILLLNICVGIVVAGTMYTFMSCSKEATDMNVMNLIQNNYEEAIAMILFGISFPICFCNRI
ncbi:MAG: hypothetical protein ACLURV_07060 [Gallintestinimicrobium sp.]